MCPHAKGHGVEPGELDDVGNRGRQLLLHLGPVMRVASDGCIGSGTSPLLLSLLTSTTFPAPAGGAVAGHPWPLSCYRPRRRPSMAVGGVGTGRKAARSLPLRVLLDSARQLGAATSQGPGRRPVMSRPLIAAWLKSGLEVARRHWASVAFPQLRVSGHGWETLASRTGGHRLGRLARTASRSTAGSSIKRAAKPPCCRARRPRCHREVALGRGAPRRGVRPAPALAPTAA